MNIPGIVTFASGYGHRTAHTINWQAIGHYFSDKYQAAALERGYRAAAAQLRKQGVPLEVAYRIFFGKELPR
jgi:hypothetical protein